MKNRVRFTFVRDRLNRTAIAALIGALEFEVDDVSDSIRVPTLKEAVDLDFDSSGRTVEVVCVSAMTVNFPSAMRVVMTLQEKWGSDAFITVAGGAHASGPRTPS